MPKARVGEIELDYEVLGEGDPLLMMNGVGTQRTYWPQGFLDSLVEAGFQCITYDHRDVGHSTHLVHLGRPSRVRFMARVLAGLPVTSPYGLRDMAVDAAGLLEHLGHERAHVLGVSMGGMVAQRMAIHRPGRVQTLISMMSSPDERRFPGKLRARASLVLPKAPTTPEEAGEAAVILSRVIGSPGFALDEEDIRRRAAVGFERGLYPDGFMRQLAAVQADGDRTSALAHVSAPTLVIHGTADVLVPPEAGAATAAAIPGAELKWVAGMGHDLPPGAWPIITQAIRAHADTHR